MVILRIKEAKKEINEKVLFENVEITIEEGEHVALIGNNGVGKTTLLKCILGHDDFTKGELYRNWSSDWGYLRQEPIIDKDITLYEYVYSAIGEASSIHSKINDLQNHISEHKKSINSETYTELNVLIEKYIDIDGYSKEIELESVLTQFGFLRDEWAKKYYVLSGGEKTRAQLARIILPKPGMIILDEPTNHLDFQALDWLENWIKNYTGTIIFVSHDREFINRVAHTTYELTQEGTKRIKGGYEEFRNQKHLENVTKKSLYEKQEREKKALKSDMQHYKVWAKRAHDSGSKTSAAKHMKKVKSREKALKKIVDNEISKPREDEKVKAEFTSNNLKIKTLIRIEDLQLRIGNRTSFKDFNMEIHNGDRIGIIGKNGIGKSSLLKTIHGIVTPNYGKVIKNPQVKLGYIPQEIDYKGINKTVLEMILEVTNRSESEVRTILGRMLFRRDQVYQNINTLSAGERVRLEFVKLYCSDINIMLLDEPTNYLDIDTLSVIERAIKEYNGTIILVTHDRHLLNTISNRLIIFEGDTIIDYRGGYQEYSEEL